ncbi:MAG: hypothetical protein IT162_20465 [Bryobacterales bacterium]|nr:hypothetical protein [Bryobacterales bacterium]
MRELLARMIALPPEARNRALAQVALLAGLRRMTGTVRMEMNRMGLAAEFKNNELLRDYFEQAEEKGRAEGRSEGRVEGHVEGRVASLRSVLNFRFGPPPAWALEKLNHSTAAELDRWLDRALTVHTLDEVFK